MSVDLEDVTFHYSAATSPALHRVTAGFRPGQVTLVTGRLGSGCSTLLMAVAGLVPHTTGGERSGRVATLGHDPASPSGRAAIAGRVGLLLPTPWTQLSGMAYSIRDEVAFGPANLGWERSRIHRAVEESLTLLAIEHLAGRDPATLSGGELQRAMLAGVVAMNPELYLLDEPTQELDAASASEVYALLPQLAANATVILATSDVDRAVGIADRVVLMDRGSVVADGSPPDVLGGVPAITAGAATTVAMLSHHAGCPSPYPATVDGALERYGR